MTRDGDRPVRTLTPDARLVLDASNCIVLVTPERRVTVTNVAEWVDGLRESKVFQQIYDEDAEQRRREAHAERARHAYDLMDKPGLVEHLLTGDGHEGKYVRVELERETALDLRRTHRRDHGVTTTRPGG